MIDYRNNDELYHYGVLGMKWGMHKAAKYAAKASAAKAAGNEKAAAKFGAKSTYSYKSMVTKHDEKKAAKLHAKADSITKKMEAKGHIVKNSDGTVSMSKNGMKAVNKAGLLNAKARIHDDRAAAGRKWDKAREDYARTADTGAAIARKLLLNSHLDRQYQNYRSLGISQRDATKRIMQHVGVGMVVSAATGGLVGARPLHEKQGYNIRKNASATSEQNYKQLKMMQKYAGR